MTGDARAVGYINQYHQVNLGTLDRPTMQKCYLFHCLQCGETYAAQSQMYRRRCPSLVCRQYDWGKGEQSKVTLTADERPASVDGRRREAIKRLEARLDSLGRDVGIVPYY